MPVRRSGIVLGFLLILTVVLIAASLAVLVSITRRALSEQRPGTEEAHRYHLVLVARRIDSPFWQEVYQGAREAGFSSGAVVELSGPASDAERTSFEEYMDYAVMARAHGIISYIRNSEQASVSIKQAAERGIPVVTLENDAVGSVRQSHVGISGYELGRIFGTLTSSVLDSGGKALVILDNQVPLSAENLMLSSMREQLVGQGNIVLQPLAVASGGQLSPDEIIRRTLIEDSDIDLVVTLTVEDTIRVAQAVIDLNRSNRISILSFRESPEILEYVRKGLIQTVVAINAQQMGRLAVESMLEYLETGHANDYVLTNLFMIDRINIEEHMNDRP